MIALLFRYGLDMTPARPARPGRRFTIAATKLGVVDARLTFGLGADGRHSAPVLHQNNKDQHGSRI